MKECPNCWTCREDEAGRCSLDGSPLLASLPGPRTLDGRYRLVRRLGGRRWSTVYEALHLGIRRRCVVKVFNVVSRRSEGFQGRLWAEAEALGRLNHPCIVGVTDFGVDPRRGGVPFLVTEYVEGRSLQVAMSESAFAACQQAVPLLEEIAAALDHAHERGVLHRNLEPSNVLLPTSANARAAVKLIGFRLAEVIPWPPEAAPSECERNGPEAAALGSRAVGLDLSDTASMSPPPDGVVWREWPRSCGSPSLPPTTSRFEGAVEYASPELLRGEAGGHAADIFAFGVIALELLTGRRALPAPPQDLGPRGTRDPATGGRLTPSLDDEMLSVLRQCLEAEPGRRPASASGAVQRMREASRSVSALEKESTSAEPQEK